MPASKPGLFKDVPHSDITYRITGVAMAVHNEHGPGHREEFYQSAMKLALPKPPCSLDFEEEFSLPIYNADGQLVYTYRVDFFVARVVLVEIKAHHEPLNNDEMSQVFDYFAATDAPVALLINFGRPRLEWKRLLPPKHIQTRRHWGHQPPSNK